MMAMSSIALTVDLLGVPFLPATSLFALCHLFSIFV